MHPDLPSLIARALPEQLAFYHLGEIRLNDRAQGPAELLELGDHRAMAYGLQGDLSAVLLFLVDEGLDLSIYAEAGNLIASRLATELSRLEELDVMISPPQTLSHAQLTRILAHPVLVDRAYLHLHEGTAIQARVLVVQIEGAISGAAHA